MGNGNGALAVVEPASGIAVDAPQQQQSIADMLALARMLKGAQGMIPAHLKTEGEIVAAIMTGQELGLGPMASLRGIYLVHGKVGLSYDAMVGLLKRAGYRLVWLEKNATCAKLKLTSPQGDEHVETFDAERAKLAGLLGGNMYKKYPEAMLSARAVSSACRAFAGEVLSGCYSREELDEIRRGKTATPVELTSGDGTYGAAIRDGLEENYGTEAVEAARQEEDDQKVWSRKFCNEHQPWLDELGKASSITSNDENSSQVDALTEKLRDWCADNNDDFRHLASNESQKIWNRLRKIAKLLGVTSKALGGWMSPPDNHAEVVVAEVVNESEND